MKQQGGVHMSYICAPNSLLLPNFAIRGEFIEVFDGIKILLHITKLLPICWVNQMKKAIAD